jgi:hypothetical protein
MIRVFAVSAITFVALYAIGAATMFTTGCTEPGDCSFAGELARDHGGEIVVGGTLGVLALGLLSTFRARSRS